MHHYSTNLLGKILSPNDDNDNNDTDGNNTNNNNTSDDNVGATFKKAVSLSCGGTGFKPPGSHRPSTMDFSYSPSAAALPALPNPDTVGMFGTIPPPPGT